MTTKISGLLVINKPKDFTSRDVVNKVSKILQTKKVGHTGTLDPIATGVLVLTINAATKLTEIITSENKEYIASVILGVKTDTLDITGQILEKRNIIIKEQDIIDVLNSFKGSYEQTVPLYSAIRINGQKLYEYARNKEEVILPKRLVNIYDIKLLEITKNGFKFKCCVSKGTYIRSLINDIASKLNTIGVMSDLIRTKQGIFELKDAYTLEDISNNNYKLINMLDVLKDYKQVNVDEQLKFKIINGQIIDNIYNEEYVLFKDDNVIALYKTYNKDKSKLKPYKMF